MREEEKIIICNGKIEKVSDFGEDKQGKIIYEVIRIIQGKPLFIEEHYDRMKNSFKLSGVELTKSYTDLRNEINQLVKANKIKEGNIKITYSIDKDLFKIFFIPHKYPTDEMYIDGVDTILYFGERENPNAKIVNNEFRSKVNEKIKLRGAYEAILVDRNGIITEGSKSNIFIIKDDIVYTSKVEAVLPGVTRTEIMKMAKEIGVKVVEEDFNYLGINDIDSMFISGTSPKILPIRRVEEKELNVNNKILRKLMSSFNNKIKKYIENLE